ncbi:MAG: LPS export ABC transporter periplasmic protein LptC [Rhizobiaceae bacterium]
MNLRTGTGPDPGHVYAAELPNSSAAEHGLEFLSSQRNEDEYRRAVKHTNRVRILKIAMPLVAGLIILGIVAALVIRQYFLPQIDLGAITVSDGKLVMENPNLNGFDKNKRPFRLTADKAVQDADQPTRVELVKISATLPIDDKISADVLAGNGVYDAEAKTLVLTKQVHVETTDGMKIDLENADIDIANGILNTGNPVFASGPQADISADSLSVEESGDRIVFEGTVRLTLRPKELREDDGTDG